MKNNWIKVFKKKKPINNEIKALKERKLIWRKIYKLVFWKIDSIILGLGSKYKPTSIKHAKGKLGIINFFI